MAISFRIAVYVGAIILFGFLAIVLNVPVADQIDPTAEQQSDSEHSMAFLVLLREAWDLKAFLFIFAASAWLIRESVYASGGG